MKVKPGAREGQRRLRFWKPWASPPVVLFLLLLAFVGGGLLGSWWRDISSVSGGGGTPASLHPATATLPPPTPTLPPTPTPTAPQTGAELATLYLEIAPDDFARLEAKRAVALESWILQADDGDYVPATARWGEQAAVPVELRLKGDWGDHFAGEKWSFRIRTRGDHYVQGMQVFSVQDPGTRTYLNEWLFLANLRQEDVLGIRYNFVHLVQNGRYMGIYALEEGFARELFEFQGRREGVLLRYNEDLLWEFWSAYENDEVVPPGVQRFHIIDEFQTGRVLDDPLLLEQRDVAAGKLRAWRAGERPLAGVFHVEALARFLALSDLWGAQHALRWHNLRYYYNPVTTLLEPVAFDTQPLAGGSRVDVEALPGLQAVHSYGDLRLQRAYTRYLWQYSQPAYLSALRARLEPRWQVLQAALEPELGDEMVPVRVTQAGNPLQEADTEVEFVSVLAPPWEALAQRQSSLRELLSPLQMAYAHVPAAPAGVATVTDTFTVAVGNLLPLPVEILGLWAGDTWYPASEGWWSAAVPDPGNVLPPQPEGATFMTYTHLTLPFTVTAAPALPDLALATRLWGMTRTVTQPVLPAYPPLLPAGPLPPPPSPEAALRQHPFLHTTAEPRLFTVAAGTWTVVGNLVLPQGYGLRLEPGARLSFGAQNFLLARGPLYFAGTPADPITLQAAGETWQGIVVLDAGGPSSWRYVTVRDTVEPLRPGWGLTGGVTFYRSPLRLDHCRFLGTQAEDALNLIHSPFEFEDVEFANTASDAFDADFCQGSITRASFHDIGADGVDASGSELLLQTLRMERLGDKGLSIGESSQVQGTDLWMDGVDFGVVSKDLSHVEVSQVTLGEVRIAGFAAYVKKPAYGPATLVARDVTFLDATLPAGRVALVQTGSWVDLNGTRIWGDPLDVDALYEKWRR